MKFSYQYFAPQGPNLVGLVYLQDLEDETGLSEGSRAGSALASVQVMIGQELTDRREGGSIRYPHQTVRTQSPEGYIRRILVANVTYARASISILMESILLCALALAIP